MKQRLKNYFRPFLKWRFLVCFFLAWMITNGWSYIFIGLGMCFNITWMLSIGTGWQAFLWLPCTPEKLVTIPIAIWFNTFLFNDERTHQELQTMKQQAKDDWQKIKNKFKRRK